LGSTCRLDSVIIVMIPWSSAHLNDFKVWKNVIKINKSDLKVHIISWFKSTYHIKHLVKWNVSMKNVTHELKCSFLIESFLKCHHMPYVTWVLKWKCHTEASKRMADTNVTKRHMIGVKKCHTFDTL
jgi:hypothetical protein